MKFQTFDPAALASADAPKAEYQKERSTGRSQREMLEALSLPKEAYPRLMAHAQSKGLVFMSSPFDAGSAHFLNSLEVPAFKIASGELTNHPMLQQIARFGRPMLVSTGMATLDEVSAAMKIIAEAGDVPVALFHCVSSYPAVAADVNLRAMATMRDAFKVPVGWSDHLQDSIVSLASVALGAQILEKHLTLDKKMPGPDHAASTEPAEFAELVRALRDIEAALGTGIKAPVPAERDVAAVARKSLHWAADFAAGFEIPAQAFTSLRPGTGVSPARLPELIGRRLARSVMAGKLVAPDDFTEEH